MNTRRTITINEHTFQKLRSVGMFGESYSDLILRLVTNKGIRGEVKRMNSQILEFRGKLCKGNNHGMCPGRWAGFGFIVTCKCNCHQNNEQKAKTSKSVWRPETNVVVGTSSLQENQKNEA
jgi:predicted CopG family antitoxin